MEQVLFKVDLEKGQVLTGELLLAQMCTSSLA